MQNGQSAAHNATEHIRAMISSGVLQPGVKVAIDDVAHSMGVSITPVRDALMRLEAEGLVEVVPRVGVYVRHIPIVEVRDVYDLKAALEPLMVRWAVVRSDDGQRRWFVESSDRLVAAADAGRVDEYVRLLEERRSKFLEFASSHVLTDVFRAIDGRVRLLRHRNLSQNGRMKESAREHAEISIAISSGDADLAERLAADHVISATASLERLLAREIVG